MSDDTKDKGRDYPVLSIVKGDDPLEKAINDGLTKNPSLNSSVIVSNAFEPEDEFTKLYLGEANKGSVIAPPYNLKTLDRFSQENNALSPCIEAMITNIDGTGYSFRKKDGTNEKNQTEDAKVLQLEQFFGEVWPGKSFMTMRKLKRRDEERLGNAYFEVIRNAQDQIVFIRHVDAKMMRLLQLDAAVPVKKTIMRNGVTQTVTVMARERRFVQYAGPNTFVYFKEFGSSRDIDKTTGKWADPGQRLPANLRGSEIIHFTALPDAHTPYGVPRWINQLPSVLGSRKAEEFNLDYFDNGGVPPVMVFVEGGILSAKTRQAIIQMTSGKASKVNRTQVIETEPTGGRIDGNSSVRVRVERFGSERQSDSMFEKYDDKCEERVRRAFRLPPIFVGMANDYSFATAHASYAVAEAQVFKPERDEFDEVMSIKVLPDLGYPEYEMYSMPLSIEDAANKLTGITLAQATNHVDPENIIEEINTATGTNLKYSQAEIIGAVQQNQIDQFNAKMTGTHPDQQVGGNAPTPNSQTNGAPPGNDNKNGTPPGTKTPAPSAAAKADLSSMVALAVDTAMALRDRNDTELQKNLAIVGGLTKAEKDHFDKAMANLQFLNVDIDPEGLSEIAACTLAIMSEHVHNCGAHH